MATLVVLGYDNTRSGGLNGGRILHRLLEYRGRISMLIYALLALALVYVGALIDTGLHDALRPTYTSMYCMENLPNHVRNCRNADQAADDSGRSVSRFMLLFSLAGQLVWVASLRTRID
jgi:hypothetical protein